MSLLASFVLSFSPLDVLDEIWDVIESVSEGFLTYSWRGAERDVGGRGKFAQHGICLEGQLVVERLPTGHRICQNAHFLCLTVSDMNTLPTFICTITFLHYLYLRCLGS